MESDLCEDANPSRDEMASDLEHPAVVILRSGHKAGQIKSQARSFKELIDRLG
jgi:hypothetical protein